MTEARPPGPTGHLDGEALCDYAEGLMAPAARAEAEAHLEGCPDCRRELEAVRGYFTDMASLPMVKAPDRFLTKVHARIAKASPWRRLLDALSSPRLLPVPLTVFTLLVVGGLTYYMSQALLEEESPASGQVSMSPPEEDRVARLAEPEAGSAPTPAGRASPEIPAPEPPAAAPSGGDPEDAPRPRARKGRAPDPAKAADAAEAPAQVAASPEAASAPPSADRAGRPAASADQYALAEKPAPRRIGRAESKSKAERAPDSDWPPVAYVLTPERALDPVTLQADLERAGIRTYRRDPPSPDAYPARLALRVPADRMPDLVARLRAYGSLTAEAQPRRLPNETAGYILTLRIRPQP